MTGYQETIKEFILEKLVRNHKGPELSTSDSLIDKGIIDSLGIQVLIAYLEKEFGIPIVDDELIPENFETIELIANLVSLKLAAAGNN